MTRRDGDCIVWVGVLANGGYAQVQIGSKKVAAHRASYELAHGPIPDGLELDHLCRNRRCVRVEHLEAVSPRVNVLRSRGPAAVNFRKDRCPRGHAYHLTVSGRRRCHQCMAAATARWRKKRAQGVTGGPSGSTIVVAE